MKQLKCTECGLFFDRALEECPNCGCPTKNIEAVQEEFNSDIVYSKKKGWIWTLVIVLLSLIGGGGYYAYFHFLNGDNEKNAIVELTPEFIEAVQQYDQLGVFNEGRAAVCKNGKWGYINIKGEEVIPCQYNVSGAFHDGLAAVKKNDKWGYINTKGEEVIPISIKARMASNFSEGKAFVYKGDENFSVIDREGKEIFSAKCLNYLDYYSEDLADDENLLLSLFPSYSQGMLYVTTPNENFVVYDILGNKIKEGDGFGKQDDSNIKEKYSTFLKENDIDKNHPNFTVGLKDSIDKEVVPAIFDRINFECAENGEISNGIVLVVLEEIGEDAIYGYADVLDSNNTKYHYGFADLKGNDTFSNDLKEKCRKKKEDVIRKLKEQEEEANRIYKEGPDWLQGAWKIELTDDYGNHLIYMYEVFNHGISKTYADDRLISERKYKVLNDRIVYDSDGGHYDLDEGKQIVIAANGQEMQKVSSNTSYIPSSSSSSFSNNSYNNGGSSDNSSHRFSSAHDVIGYLADKTFYNGNRRMRIRPNGIWLNDYCATGAPIVERYESWKALIRAYSATGQRVSFMIDPIHGQIIDEAGDVFYLR